MDLPRCRQVSWLDVERWSDRLEEVIRGAGRVPETIIGLTRGGWVPSRMLADRLGVKRLLSLRAQHWGVTATPTGEALLSERISVPVEGENILLVDDITDTGESLALAKEHVVTLRPGRLETATYLHIQQARLRPTYVAEEIPRGSWVWFVFPWNYWEDLRTLARRAAELRPDPRAVQGVLRERCQWEVPERDVARALASP
jgi:hypoxanthine phosphoribosyltransferase